MIFPFPGTNRLENSGNQISDVDRRHNQAPRIAGTYSTHLVYGCLRNENACLPDVIPLAKYIICLGLASLTVAGQLFITCPLQIFTCFFAVSLQNFGSQAFSFHSSVAKPWNGVKSQTLYQRGGDCPPSVWVYSDWANRSKPQKRKLTKSSADVTSRCETRAATSPTNSLPKSFGDIVEPNDRTKLSKLLLEPTLSIQMVQTDYPERLSGQIV
jgi:hypothetical protein